MTSADQSGGGSGSLDQPSELRNPKAREAYLALRQLYAERGLGGPQQLGERSWRRTRRCGS